MYYDWLIVGAGFAGSILAERLASQMNQRVLVIDRRSHVGGNAYDELDAAGIRIHRYGPHIFHTNSAAIFEHLSQFTEWRPYEHRVLASVRGMLVPIPINLDTVNRLYGLDLNESELEAWYQARAEPSASIRTSEDVVVSRVGRELYELFFRGYTRKQWGLDPSQLDASVTSRVPTRTDRDDRYFSDEFQAMPREGYTAMFARILDHPNITVALEADFDDVRETLSYGRLAYTGPIDDFFRQRFGPLPYRSLEFEFKTLDVAQFQQTGTVNYPSEDVPYTRISEFKHLTGEWNARTTVVYEYPRATGDPYYPIPRPENAELYARYQALAEAHPEVVFVGRLATYRYYNMDQVVGQALATFRRIEAGERAGATVSARDRASRPVASPLDRAPATASSGLSIQRSASSGLERRIAPPAPIVCLSHLPWDGVFQRPNHLMTRAARDRQVVWVDPPRVADIPEARLTVTEVAPNLLCAVPELPAHLAPNTGAPHLRRLLDGLVVEHGIRRPIVWYYTPIALRFAGHLESSLVVYDSMDDLTAFRHAPPLLAQLEPSLLERADLVFAGGTRLWHRLQDRRADSHNFPSSVDVDHFARARSAPADPPSQASFPRPRIGYAGVIDERIDLHLLRDLAAARRDWSFVLVGPTTKIEADSVPQAANIHALGRLPYEELPAELGAWDVAIMPFARNEATRSISPTKTLEYLAAGLPVVSTSIPDVVEPYGRLGLVRIADDVTGWIAAIEAALVEERGPRLAAADALLADRSWDRTWAAMRMLVEAKLRAGDLVAAERTSAPRRSEAAPTPRAATIAAVASAATKPGRVE